MHPAEGKVWLFLLLLGQLGSASSSSLLPSLSSFLHWCVPAASQSTGPSEAACQERHERAGKGGWERWQREPENQI